jgi:hypothetical protein
VGQGWVGEVEGLEVVESHRDAPHARELRVDVVAAVVHVLVVEGLHYDHGVGDRRHLDEDVHGVLPGEHDHAVR